jgi:hypothetical protein
MTLHLNAEPSPSKPGIETLELLAGAPRRGCSSSVGGYSTRAYNAFPLLPDSLSNTVLNVDRDTDYPAEPGASHFLAKAPITGGKRCLRRWSEVPPALRLSVSTVEINVLTAHHGFFETEFE